MKIVQNNRKQMAKYDINKFINNNFNNYLQNQQETNIFR